MQARHQVPSILHGLWVLLIWDSTCEFITLSCFRQQVSNFPKTLQVIWTETDVSTCASRQSKHRLPQMSFNFSKHFKFPMVCLPCCLQNTPEYPFVFEWSHKGMGRNSQVITSVLLNHHRCIWYHRTRFHIPENTAKSTPMLINYVGKEGCKKCNPWHTHTVFHLRDRISWVLCFCKGTNTQHTGLDMGHELWRSTHSPQQCPLTCRQRHQYIAEKETGTNAQHEGR